MDMGDEQGFLGEDNSYDRGKRNYDDDDDDYDDRRKRMRSDGRGGGSGGNQIEVRVLIPSRVAGSIIGKGGENVKNLRSKYSASITIPDSNTPERIVSIRAEKDAALDILYNIIPLMDENKRDNKNNPDYEGDLRFLVHHSLAGCIIGRQGSQIKSLREETNTNVKVFQEKLPGSTDRLVQVTGKIKKMVDAVGIIFRLMEKSKEQGHAYPYNPENYDEFSVSGYGGFYPSDRRQGGGGRDGDRRRRFGGGGGGFSGGRSDGDRGGRNQDWGDKSGSRYRDGGRGSGGSGSFRGDDFGSSGFGSRNDSFNQGYNIPSMLGALGRKGGRSGGGNFMGDSMSDSIGDLFEGVTTTQVTIPNDLAGAIIGRGGENIRLVRQKSNTMIDIDKPKPGQDERIITITGRPHQIQHAQFLLQQSVRATR